ncbi:MAG: MoxR family ATPase [Acidobacteria bacterium]|nr:MoxR family ATPase [Acidobacteriota bacterium]
MNNDIYQGKGETLAQRNAVLEPHRDTSRQFDPARYLADDSSRDAVITARILGMPLLITGEPGCGKTQLAHSVAWEWGTEAHVFNTRSDSTYQKLVYDYDHLRHFTDSQLKRERPIADYIVLGAAAKAIRDAASGKPSVLLIDEIDKAPRDLPNDILNEIERLEFTVRETGERYAAPRDNRPLILFTSNRERDLPEAFLRRCLFHHMAFPGPDRLKQIVEARLGSIGFSIDEALKLFLAKRELARDKQPSTGELLAWLTWLDHLKITNLSPADEAQRAALQASYRILAKTEADLKNLQ